jgi:hypothetical protein
VLEPLERFCRAPAIDPTREAFAFRPSTPIPADDWKFRIKRRLGTLRADGGSTGAGGGRRST